MDQGLDLVFEVIAVGSVVSVVAVEFTILALMFLSRVTPGPFRALE